MASEVWTNGVRRERWDDTTRTYTAWNASGVQTASRPYTAAENASTDAYLASNSAIANETNIKSSLETALAELRVIRDDTNSNINANPAARIKDLARINLSIVRFLLRRFDGTN